MGAYGACDYSLKGQTMAGGVPCSWRCMNSSLNPLVALRIAGKMAGVGDGPVAESWHQLGALQTHTAVWQVPFRHTQQSGSVHSSSLCSIYRADAGNQTARWMGRRGVGCALWLHSYRVDGLLSLRTGLDEYLFWVSPRQLAKKAQAVSNIADGWATWRSAADFD